MGQRFGLACLIQQHLQLAQQAHGGFLFEQLTPLEKWDGCPLVTKNFLGACLHLPGARIGQVVQHQPQARQRQQQFARQAGRCVGQAAQGLFGMLLGQVGLFQIEGSLRQGGAAFQQFME